MFAKIQPHSEYYANARPEIVPFLPEIYTRVLEIGCGEGRFRLNMKRDCEYFGVEFCAHAAAAAETLLDRVFVGSYDAVARDIPDSYFDLVICNDVIEHMPDHHQFLARIKEKMRPGAFLVGSIPNVRYLPNLFSILFDKEWRYTDSGLLDRTHQRFFTMLSLQRTLLEMGYTVESLKGVNPLGLGERSFRKFVKLAAISLIGLDSRYLQIGFRARLID